MRSEQLQPAPGRGQAGPEPPQAPSDAFRAAVHSQPENLRAAREACADAIHEIDLGPLTRGTIVFSGIGASAHAVTPAVLALRAGGRRAVAVSSAELTEAPARNLGDAFVLVSQSGASAETVRALAHLDGAPVLAISGHAESPLAQAAAAWLPLGPLEDTPVATLSYTATLQTLGMLCDALLGTASGWRDLPALTRGVLERTDPGAQRIAESLAEARAIDAVGGGVARAAAAETALLVREGLRLPAAGMETREYLHGPLEAVRDGFGCVVFGGEREDRLAAQLGSFGARVALITDRRGAPAASVQALEIPRTGNLVAPILQILPAQLLIYHLARLRHVEVGHLRRQQPDTKVVRMEGGGA